MPPRKKTMLSAMQPTNPMTLGNLIGAMRNWTRYQEQYDNIFFVVDQHAITLRQDPKQLREQSYRMIATFIAAGLEPDNSLLFLQSHVPQHSQLAWILMCHTYMGELSRMTQFKDKSAKQENIPVGIFVYPTLMAADILLYQAQLVPVGHDQKQHVELTRDIALRMNRVYDRELFAIPEPFIPKVGARIMSLQEPTRKMNKSDPDRRATVFLTDTDKQIEKKIKAAVTDSGNEITHSPDQPGVRNLIEIQCALQHTTPEQVVAEYAGKMYGQLKGDTAQLVVSAVAPIREETERLLADRGYLNGVLSNGAKRAQERADKTLQAVVDAVGFVPPPTS